MRESIIIDTSSWPGIMRESLARSCRILNRFLRERCGLLVFIGAMFVGREKCGLLVFLGHRVCDACTRRGHSNECSLYVT